MSKVYRTYLVSETADTAFCNQAGLTKSDKNDYTQVAQAHAAAVLERMLEEQDSVTPEELAERLKSDSRIHDVSLDLI